MINRYYNSGELPRIGDTIILMSIYDNLRQRSKYDNIYQVKKTVYKPLSLLSIIVDDDTHWSPDRFNLKRRKNIKLYSILLSKI